jgi:Uma2 family endonuclease
MTAIFNPPALRPTPLTSTKSPVHVAPHPATWTREDFMAINSLPEMQGRRLQLLRGVIWDYGIMNSPHAAAVSRGRRRLAALFGLTTEIRVQLPVDVDSDTMPQPDLAVVPFRDDDYVTAHPTASDASLVVEVADSSLQIDLTEKAELYALAGIREYWVLDVLNRVLYVLRDPGPLAANGTAYRDQRTLSPDDTVSPLAAPDATVTVADLLP